MARGRSARPAGSRPSSPSRRLTSASSSSGAESLATRAAALQEGRLVGERRAGAVS